MPRFDYQCTVCGFVRNDVQVNEHTVVLCKNPDGCAGLMERLPAAPNFKVEGYSAANGYSHK